jgi:hypothetical protein
LRNITNQRFSLLKWQQKTTIIKEDLKTYLHGIVQKIRANAQMGVTYMTMEERDRQIREDGKLEGVIEGEMKGEIKAYLKVGLSVKQITEMMDLPEDKVLEIIQELKQ